MKLPQKLALYNIFTKVAIIGVSGLLILFSVEKVLTNHLKQRLIDKRYKMLAHLSPAEIDDLMNPEKSFTDYNILKEEYIILNEVKDSVSSVSKPEFTQDSREIENVTQEYIIMTDYFTYGGKNYKLEIGETMVGIRELERTILYFTLIIMIVSVALSFIADLAFTRFLLTPFYRIIDRKINKVNDPIHYNYNRISTSTDDFKLLDESINLLMKKISDQMLTQKQFTSNVSHELLTPISILRSRLENIMNDEALSDHVVTKLVSSLRTLTRLQAIINSLLLISKVESNQFSKSDSISIQDVVKDVTEELEERLEAKEILLENRMKYHFVVKGNAPLLHTLIMNIVNNAIKYNRKGGTVIIEDDLAHKRYCLHIKDTGIGMAPEQIELAFSRFEKLGTSDEGSHGLGLAIVKSIAAFHGIEIEVESQKGKGTSVTLIFPEHSVSGS